MVNKTPEVYCKILNRKVDGGYCAFICTLPETEKKIAYNPFRGIYTDCGFSKKLSEIETEPASESTPTIMKDVKISESKNPEKLSLKILPTIDFQTRKRRTTKIGYNEY